MLKAEEQNFQIDHEESTLWSAMPVFRVLT